MVRTVYRNNQQGNQQEEMGGGAGHVQGKEDSECIKEKVKKRNRLENLDVDGKMELKEREWECTDRTYAAQDKAN
jgi:hypothetical protein